MSHVTAAPSRGAAWALVGLAVFLAVVAVLTDPGGRLLATPAALIALALGVRDLVLRPVLQAGPEGLTFVSGLRRGTARWEEVTALRLVTDRRASLLEIDLDDRVLLLSRGRLGRPPRDVLEELEQVRAGVSR